MSRAVEGGGPAPARVRTGRRGQTWVLTSRYAACTAGDLRTVALLVLQAPFIGWLCTLVWGSVETDTPSLHFVMCLAAVWFGCINACREIIKERAIVERERLLGLSLGRYVVSKVIVLAVLGLVQVLLLQIAVEWKLGIKGPFLLQTAALFGASLCGTGLGLVVSAVAARQERAVGAVPLLILPQILFSEFAIPARYFEGLIGVVEKAMPVHWAYEVFAQGAAAEPALWTAVLALVALAIYAAALVLLTAVALRRQRTV